MDVEAPDVEAQFQALRDQITALSAQLTDLDLRYVASEAERQTLEEKVKEAQEEAREARQSSASAGPSGGTHSQIDTKGLGKPEIFHGETKKWPEWKMIGSAYLRCLHRRLGVLMDQADLTNDNVANAALAPADRQASEQLYFALLMLMRGPPLTVLSNCGDGEGLLAWREFCRKHDEVSKEHFIHKLYGLLHFDLNGDVDERLDLFDKKVAAYEKASKETLTDNMKIGIVISQLPDSPLRAHIKLHIKTYASYVGLRKEIVDVMRAQQAPDDMDCDGIDGGDADALNKGGPKGRGRGKKKGS